MEGPLVKRVLFVDLLAPKAAALTELVGQHHTIVPAKWGTNLAPVRRQTNKVGFKPGPSLKTNGVVTWMLYPLPLAVHRPINKPVKDPGDMGNVAAVTGYLILQLELDTIRDRLVPKVLEDHFGDLAGDTRQTVSIAIDGEGLLVYEPSDSVAGRSAAAADQAAGYSLQTLPQPSDTELVASAEPGNPFLLSSGSIPQPAWRRGPIQQIALKCPVEILRSIVTQRGEPGPQTNLGLDQADTDELFRTELTDSIGLPRLFLVSEQTHQLTIRAEHAAITLRNAMNSDYLRSVEIQVLGLALLVGVFGIGAAQRAEMRMGAVASQTHPLPTPLAAITIPKDNLASGKVRPDDEVIEHAGNIRNYGEQLNGTVDSTVDLAAIKSLKKRSGLTLIDVSREAR